MKLYNSLTRTKEDFVPIIEGKVTMYHCGPTVYDYIHIGNLRSFFMGDILRRTFEFLGYDVKQVMNITDIGHLVSDGDEGNDKMTKALKRHNMEITLENMLKIADFYADAFKEDLKNLNILTPHVMPKASQHILEDIELVKKLEEKGYTYRTSDGIYFDTSKMKDYGKLGGIQRKDRQGRIEENTEKKHPADFALWKFDEKNGWPSPWGQGFPGWHIECSGMSMKYLGETIDIHTGGKDLKPVHHNNEIAQSECATGKQFVRYWLHGEFLNINGEKLSKSKGGNITLRTLEEKGFSPLALRYLYLQAHYRSPMNFSWEILEGAEKGLKRIYRTIRDLKGKTEGKVLRENSSFVERFKEALEDDFNTAEALAVLHTLLKSDISDEEKLGTALLFDRVLGLELDEMSEKNEEEEETLPEELTQLLQERARAREAKDWETSDALRAKINEMGYSVADVNGEQIVQKKNT